MIEIRQHVESHSEFFGEFVDVTAFFVVVLGIGPKKASIPFHGSPALVKTLTRTHISTLSALDSPLQFLERHGVVDELVVVLQRLVGQVYEGLEVCPLITVSRSVNSFLGADRLGVRYTHRPPCA